MGKCFIDIELCIDSLHLTLDNVDQSIDMV